MQRQENTDQKNVPKAKETKSLFTRVAITFGTTFFPSYSREAECRRLEELHELRLKNHQAFIEGQERFEEALNSLRKR